MLRLRLPLLQRVPVLSLERALYLAKEAGIFTTKELQTHAIKSPSFSRTDGPFVLEDFFVSIDDKEMDALPKKVKPAKPPKEVLSSTEGAEAVAASQAAAAELVAAAANADDAANTMNAWLLSAVHPSGVPPQFNHEGREFLWRSTGEGTKKRARAQVVLMRGSGLIKVNGYEDFWKRWPLYYNRFDVLKPFQVTGMCGVFDVFINVKGGGISGQAVAARLAIARALVQACGATAPALEECLYEDPRQKVSKMAGRNAAFARDKNKQ